MTARGRTHPSSLLQGRQLFAATSVALALGLVMIVLTDLVLVHLQEAELIHGG